ncbi:MAG: transcriptional regulator [Oscillatoria sp. SIO1A7]|nr:transcriptional regulator [Oscillatoria sp. SIO1A7]
MKIVKAPTTRSYQDYLISSLKAPEEAAAYIEAVLEEKNPEPSLLASALQDAIAARVRSNNLSAEAQNYWEKLEELLSASGGAEIYTLVALLDALGFRLVVAVGQDDRLQ